MYESFYGLSGKPFQLNPDPSFFFGSREHRRAMAYLEYGLHQNEGFIVITGEIGAGKTTLVRGLLDKLDPDTVIAAQLVSTQLGAEDTLRMVGAAFGLRTSDVSKSDVLLSLEAFLVELSEQGKRALLIVDEAQNLAPRAVEELRMLSNFQLETHALLQSFLIGQPEFRRTMERPQMQQLRQRVIASCHIGPMDADETRGYIEHRLKCVGWKSDPKFDDEAYQAIFQVTGGIPRRINSLCDRTLLSGFLADKHHFTKVDVETIGREIRAETFTTVSMAPPSELDTPESPTNEKVLEHGALDIDLSRFEIDAEAADRVSSVVDALRSSQIEERLSRLERNSTATLALLQQLVEAVRVRQSDKNEP